MPRRGFTLVEVAVVLILLGILAGLIIPALTSSVRHEKLYEAKDDLLALRHAIVQWAKAHSNTLPANLTSANLPSQDIWGRDYFYTRYESGDICNNPGPANANLTLNGKDINASFVLISHGPDTTHNIDTSGALIDLTEPHDDLYTYMGHDELYYLICSTNGTQAHNATKYLLYSTAAMTIPQNSQIQGDVASNGALTINQNVAINGTIASGGSVSMLHNTSATGIIAAGAILLAQNINISGDIHAGGSVTIAPNTHIYGNVYAAGAVTIQGTVHGNVFAGGAVIVIPPGSVTGTIQHNLGANVPGLKTYQSPGIPKLQVFAATGPNVTVSSTLTPGNYGQVTIPNNGQLTLGSGVYIFQSLSLGNNAQLRFNLNATGTLADITLLVRGAVSLSNPQVQFSTNGTYVPAALNHPATKAAAARVYLESHGSVSITGATTVWMGGILTNGTATINTQGVVGHITTIAPGTMSLGTNTAYEYVPSHFAQTHW
jgi:prepilin-type N-terminal cleavage/methylation domain-containing protein